MAPILFFDNVFVFFLLPSFYVYTALSPNYNRAATLCLVYLFNIFRACLIEIKRNIQSHQIENHGCLYFILSALSSLDDVHVLRR